MSSMLTLSTLLFHNLFTVTCIQRAKTDVMMGLVVLWNAALSVRGCRSIAWYARRIASYQGRAGVDGSSGEDHQNCVERRVLELLDQPEAASAVFRRDPQIFLSSYPPYQSAKWTAAHQKLL